MIYKCYGADCEYWGIHYEFGYPCDNEDVYPTNHAQEFLKFRDEKFDEFCSNW